MARHRSYKTPQKTNRGNPKGNPQTELLNRDRKENIEKHRATRRRKLAANPLYLKNLKRARRVGFTGVVPDSVVARYEQWVRNKLSGPALRLPKDHPLRDYGITIDPIKAVKVFEQIGLTENQCKKLRETVREISEVNDHLVTDPAFKLNTPTTTTTKRKGRK